MVDETLKLDGGPEEEKPEGREEPDAGVDVMQKIKEKLTVKTPDEIKRPAKFIKMRDLQEIIKDLIRRYGGLAQADLLQKIAELEMKMAEMADKHQRDLEAALASEREKAAVEYRERILELEKLVEIERGRASDLEAKLAEARAELDRLAREIAALKEQLGPDAMNRAELERLVAELKARIVELEIGLDFFSLEEEPDLDKTLNAVDEAGKRVEGRPPTGAVGAARDRVSWLRDRARVSKEKFDLLREKMHEGKGTVGVVVDMVKSLKDGDAAEAQARSLTEGLDAK